MNECPTPTKRRYLSRADAKRGKRRLAGVDSVHGVRAYLCPCGFWHIGHRRNVPVGIDECARRFASGTLCGRAANQYVDVAGQRVWLCDDHMLEFDAVRRRIRTEAAA